MGSHTSNLDDGNFDDFVKNGAAVVDFWAEWCGPCKVMGPIFSEAAEELRDKAKFGKVDVDANPELAQRFQVLSIPTLIFFRDGHQVDRYSGILLKESIKEKIKSSR